MEIIESFATLSPCWNTNIYQQGLAPDKRDTRYNQYYNLFAQKKIKLMLHSLGCPRASADYQSQRWNVATNTSAIAHAVIDSNDGIARQNLRWDMRGWHCCDPGNNTHVGVEMCESDKIKYRTDKPWLFDILDRPTVERHCRTAYNGAVELFAYLCNLFSLDPLKDICSHKEGHAMGIASNHGDPEHYWTGVGLGYTMDGFRADVKAAMASASVPATTAAGFLGFPDVSADDWYADALKWAVEHNVILQSGKPFYPDNPFTKAAAVVLLRRMWNAIQKEG